MNDLGLSWGYFVREGGILGVSWSGENSKFFKNDSNKMEEFILIGTGGSSLGAEALMSAIDDNNKLNYHILNNLDSSKVNSLLKQIEFKNFKVFMENRNKEKIKFYNKKFTNRV